MVRDRQEPTESFGVELTDEEFELFRTILLNETGIVLKETKRQLVKNRLRPLLISRRRKRFAELLDGLASPEERHLVLGEIIEAITTNLTEFFREAHQFELFRDRCLPWLVRLLEEDQVRTVSLWSAGCSSGQEPYSLAMFLRENVPPHLVEGFRIVATDIDRVALATARRGRYTEAEVAGLTDLRRRQHLTRTPEGDWEVLGALREMVRFRPLNLSRPQQWGFACYHAIFCRNVMIYFAQTVKDRLIQAFHGHLQKGGYLFLGHSEGIQGAGQGLEYVGPACYRKGT